MALLDTGSSINAISMSILAKITSKADRKLLDKSIVKTIQSVCGSSHDSMGTIALTFQVKRQEYSQIFHVFRNLFCKVLLGRPFITQSEANGSLSTHCNTLGNEPRHINLVGPPQEHIGLVRVAKSCILLHDSEIISPVAMSQYRNSTILLEPFHKQSPTLVARCVVSLDNSSRACLRLLNAGDKDITLRCHTVIAQVSIVDTETITAVFVSHDDTGVPRNSSSQCS